MITKIRLTTSVNGFWMEPINYEPYICKDHLDKLVEIPKNIIYIDLYISNKKIEDTYKVKLTKVMWKIILDDDTITITHELYYFIRKYSNENRESWMWIQY